MRCCLPQLPLLIPTCSAPTRGQDHVREKPENAALKSLTLKEFTGLIFEKVRPRLRPCRSPGPGPGSLGAGVPDAHARRAACKIVTAPCGWWGQCWGAERRAGMLPC